jgi:hypothetical protein
VAPAGGGGIPLRTAAPLRNLRPGVAQRRVPACQFVERDYRGLVRSSARAAATRLTTDTVRTRADLAGLGDHFGVGGCQVVADDLVATFNHEGFDV